MAEKRAGEVRLHEVRAGEIRAAEPDTSEVSVAEPGKPINTCSIEVQQPQRT